MNQVLGRLAVVFAFAMGCVSSAEARPLRVMTFNTMCDFCGKRRETGRFRDRLEAVADTIRRHDPDLVSLQEVRARSQVRKLSELLDGEYAAVYAKGAILSYPDATLLIRKDRFRILKKGGFWLGPRMPRFSFGWKAAFPRRVEWADLEDRETEVRFRFVGSHFDNSTRNKEPTAVQFVEWIRRAPLPVLFGADTNLNPSMTGYGVLRSFFRDSFVEASGYAFYSSAPARDEEACGLSGKASFPECRIDHVLLSRNAPWRVRSWGLDMEKYHGSLGFASDHRAVVVELEPVSR